MCSEYFTNFTFGKGIVWSVILILSYIFAIISWVVSITFGILALIPTDPFVQRHLALGVILILGCIVPIIPFLTFLITLAIMLFITAPYFIFYKKVNN